MSGPERVNVLLVEDNPGDARLVQEVLRGPHPTATLHWVENGIDALAFLSRQGKYGSVPRPDLVLLDLNLPRMDGREVLSAIKRSPEWHAIPVVVLTSSRAEQDICRCYDLHANAYVVKPTNLDELTHAIESLESFWTRTVTLPTGE